MQAEKKTSWHSCLSALSVMISFSEPWGWCQRQLTSRNWWACNSTGSHLKSSYDFLCLSVISSSHPEYAQHDLGSKLRTAGYDWKNINATTGIRIWTQALGLKLSINLETLIWNWHYSEMQHQILDYFPKQLSNISIWVFCLVAFQMDTLYCCIPGLRMVSV